MRKTFGVTVHFSGTAYVEVDCEDDDAEDYAYDAFHDLDFNDLELDITDMETEEIDSDE